MKKLTSLWLSLLLALAPLAGCAPDVGVIGGADGPTAVITSDSGGSDDAQPNADTAPPADADGGAAASFDPADYPAVTGTQTLLLGDTVLDEEGWFTGKEEVALYLMQYGTLPQNYITKKDAQALGWEGGSLDPYAPGKSIGGDRFGNYEGSLPDADGRSYTECDIDTAGAAKRGAKRIVFSNDGLIFYTEDHYNTFTLLVGGT